jgi:protein gp37
MGETTNIAWTDHTFNPWIGCTKVGPGCDHCYAEELDQRRFSKTLAPAVVHWGPGAPRHRTSRKNWELPLRWNREAAAAGRHDRVFCASLADVFDNEAPEGAREDLWDLVARTPYLNWQLLTKRIGNVSSMVPRSWLRGASFDWPPNVWLGITVVNQQEVDRDVPKLLELNPVTAFLSIEPQVAPISLARRLGNRYVCGARIKWVIVGGESGDQPRLFDPDWARIIRDDCKDHGVAFFMKQMGSAAGLRDRAGADPAEWHADLRVREFPQ